MQARAYVPMAPRLLDIGIVWYTAVIVIVSGHVFAVYLDHVMALRFFHADVAHCSVRHPC